MDIGEGLVFFVELFQLPGWWGDIAARAIQKGLLKVGGTIETELLDV